MITSGQNTSLLIKSQLPEFIRDNPDYANFVLFLQAYYEWMEQNGGVTDGTKNLLNYDDIDATSEQFLQYFVNDFLPYFPQDALISQDKAVKVAKQLYESKGTPASYQFLFRILYNSDFDIFYTKDAVLKASAGNWYVPKSLKVIFENQGQAGIGVENFLNKQNYRIFGESTKSIATIETVVLSGTKAEIFISNIERLFQSGEFVRVVDNNNQDVLDQYGQPIVGKVVGQISQIKIDPNNRGLYYAVGDPAIVHGGLSSNNGIGAVATVGSITTGAIQRINVIDGGYGYQTNPNTVINIPNSSGATAIVGSVNPDPNKTAIVSLLPFDAISLAQYTTIGNAKYSFFSSHQSANANTSLANSFTFTSLTTYPIASILVTNSGAGLSSPPVVSATSILPTSVGQASLASLGILAPIQIVNPGYGYRANDTITLIGGSGYGAYANISNVYANGGIASISYVYSQNNKVQTYPLGGLGYNNGLPTANIVSSNTGAANAVIVVPGILGAGAQLSAVTDRAGSITSFNITNYGEDYIAAPTLSLKIQDIVVSNAAISLLPQLGDVVYQGTSLNTASYLAIANSISLLQSNNDPTQSLWNLRIYDYNGYPNPSLPLKVAGKNIALKMANFAYNSYYNSNGIRTYGDGTAKGTVAFLNGLTIGQGQYLNTTGQPSSFDVLQSENYNNFTYEITVEKEIAKYRDILLNLLHPTGMKILGRYKLIANVTYNSIFSEALQTGLSLQDYTGYPASSVTMTTNFTNKSNNIVQFNNLAGANLASFITTGIPGTANSILEITPTNGPSVRSEIIGINNLANTVTLKENTWLTFANVAYVTANSGNNIINISTLTGAYNYINNGNYSNTAYPLLDIVYPGDTVLVDNNTSKVVSTIDYTHGKIYLTTNLTANVNNGLLSVNRTFNTTSVRIFGPSGLQYIPQLITEDGNTLTTEDNNIILLG